MNAQDLVVFVDKFVELRRAFQLRGDHSEVTQVAEVYFRALIRFPLRSVLQGADLCIEKCDRFPRAAEWIRHIPRASVAAYLPMQEPESGEHRRAVSLWYQDEPCSCHECQAAGVSHRMLRYVPDEDRDWQDKRMLLDGKVVVAGHWTHGEELKRWYAARDVYFGLRDKYVGKLPRRIKKVTQAQIEAEAYSIR